MRIGLIIADFELSFTTSFQNTARVKYNVNFDNSKVVDIKQNLEQLKEHLRKGKSNDVNVGYDFAIQDVEHIEKLLEIIVNAYIKIYALDSRPNKKIYTLIDQLRQAENQTPKEVAKEVLIEILTPPLQPKLTRKQRLEADSKAKSMERAMKLIKKTQLKK